MPPTLPRIQGGGVGIPNSELRIRERSRSLDRQATTLHTVATMNELILIVDDEEGIITTLSQILVDEGYRTLTTPSGEEALHLFREQRPDGGDESVRVGGVAGGGRQAGHPSAPIRVEAHHEQLADVLGGH